MPLRTTLKFFLLLLSLLCGNFLFAQNSWTWIAGLNGLSQKGHYGTLGTPAATNTPGSRFGTINWTDLNGNLWLYGGWGKDTGFVTGGCMADLWKFDVSLNQWVWIKGSNINFQGTNPVYGTMGVASPTSNPGYRSGSATWTDSAGDLWLFGGNALDLTGTGGCYKNDIWKYNIASNMWTWVGGSSNCYSYATYGTRGVMTSSNTPGARTGMCFWKDAAGNVWIWGGNGVITSSSNMDMNDLWKYDVSAGQWTWIHGSNSFTAASVHGTMGIASSTTTPGARTGSMTWIDKSGKLWLFGGVGNDALGNHGTLSDLWKYDPSSNQWTWMRGPKNRNQGAIYGSMNVYASANQPGAMSHNACWTDSTGNTLYFSVGGTTDHLNGGFHTNTMWKYNIPLNQWAWVKGPNYIADHFATYGTKGVPAIGNIPGGRHSSSWWQGNNGEFWLFGGFGAGTNTCCLAMLNDLWKFDPCYGGVITVTNTSSSSNTVVCGYSTVTLTAAGTGTLSWYDVNSNLVATGNSLAVSVGTAAPTYIISDNSSCMPTSITVSVLPTPTINITSSPASLCEGATATLTAISGAAFSSWSNGSTNYSTTVTPSVTTTYSVQVTNYPYGCTNSAVKTVTVIPVPTLTLSASSGSICSGSTVTMTALSAATAFSWTTGNTSSVVTVTPGTTTTYTVRAITSGCQKAASVTVSVTPSPTLTVLPASTVVCQGSAITMTALTNAGNYLWSNGGTGSVTTVSPGGNTTYSVLVTDPVSACSRTGATTFSVVSPPTLTLSAGSLTMCQGMIVQLYAQSNATSYVWNNVQGSPIWNVSPTTTTGYTVVVSDNVSGCASSSAVTISVTPSPTVTIIASSTTMCPGGAVTMTATGSAGTFSWNTGPTSSTLLTQAPGLYTVSLSDPNTGCSAYASEIIGMMPPAFVYIAADSPSMCAGQLVVLHAQGNSLTYSWSTGQTTSSIVVTPGTTTTYSVLATDFVTTCTASAQQTISVIPLPTLSVTSNFSAVCPGGVVTVTALSNASGYLWNTGSTSPQIAVTIHSFTPLSITVTDGSTGCTNTSGVLITALPIPSVSISGPQLACENETVTLVANAGAVSYSWMPAGNSQTLAAAVSTNTTYTVHVTDIATGCTNTAVHSIIMLPQPTLSVWVSNDTVCIGAAVSMTLFTSAGMYAWSTGGTGTTEVFSPVAITVVTITATDEHSGCTNVASKTIFVHPAIPLRLEAERSTICEGESVMLDASGAVSYSWSTGAQTHSIIETPSVTTTYSVTGYDTIGCMTGHMQTITVDACTGIPHSFSGSGAAEVYPNPTSGEVNVKLLHYSAGDRIEICNALGQVILRHEITSAHTLLSIPAANGIYFLRTNGIRVIRIIKQ